MTAAAPSPSFWTLLSVFISGGLLFSTVLTLAATVYAFGIGNLRRVMAVVQVVMRRVLKVVGATMRATWIALSAKESSQRWQEARAVLRQGLERARQTAIEGVDAVKVEASQYAVIVGTPGLLTLQYVLDRLTPRTFVPYIEAALSGALAGVDNKNIRQLHLTRFNFGSAVPQLMSGRMFELGPETLAMDLDVAWASDLQSEMQLVTKGMGARIPIIVRNLRFKGTVRLVMTQLQRTAPGFGAVLLSLPSVPEIGLDVKVAGGELTRLPWLRSEIQKIMQKSIEEEMLVCGSPAALSRAQHTTLCAPIPMRPLPYPLQWPRRIVVPAEVMPTTGSSAPKRKPRLLLSQEELAKLATDDPLLQAERALAASPVLDDDPRKSRRGALLGSDGSAADRLLEVVVAVSDGESSSPPSNHSTEGGRMDNSSIGDGRGGQPTAAQWWAGAIGRLRGGERQRVEGSRRPSGGHQSSYSPFVSAMPSGAVGGTVQLPTDTLSKREPTVGRAPWRVGGISSGMGRMDGARYTRKSPPPSPTPPAPAEPSVSPLPSAVRGLDAARKGALQILLMILQFKPPVGAVLVLQAYRLLRRRSILEDASSFFPTSRRRSRSLDLDTGDRNYELDGGIHLVRVELYRAWIDEAIARLEHAAPQAPTTEPSVADSDGTSEGRAFARDGDEGDEDAHRSCSKEGTAHADGKHQSARTEAKLAYLRTMRVGLSLNCGQKSSRQEFVSHSHEYLRDLQTMRTSLEAESAADGESAAEAASASAGRSGDLIAQLLVRPVGVLIDIRAMDSLVRLLRDKLLLSAKILEQAQAEQRTRARKSRETTQLERTQLARTGALLERQLEWLGGLQQLLLSRPQPLSASVLVNPLALLNLHLCNDCPDGQHGEGRAAAGPSTEEHSEAASSDHGPDSRSIKRPPLDEAWCAASSAWSRRARHLVSEIVGEIADSVVQESATVRAKSETLAEGVAQQLARAHEPFGEPIAQTQAHVQQLRAWAPEGGSDGLRVALLLVEGLPQAQRVQRYLLPGYAFWYSRMRAVPTSVAMLLASWMLHAAVKPSWPEVVSTAQTARSIALGVWMRRFYAPIKDIVLDLLNRGPRLSDASALEDAEHSLSTMLGEFLADEKKKVADRAGALGEVSRAYEREIKRGVRGALGGKLMRLILLQV